MEFFGIFILLKFDGDEIMSLRWLLWKSEPSFASVLLSRSL